MKQRHGRRAPSPPPPALSPEEQIARRDARIAAQIARQEIEARAQAIEAAVLDALVPRIRSFLTECVAEARKRGLDASATFTPNDGRDSELIIFVSLPTAPDDDRRIDGMGEIEVRTDAYNGVVEMYATARAEASLPYRDDGWSNRFHDHDNATASINLLNPDDDGGGSVSLTDVASALAVWQETEDAGAAWALDMLGLVMDDVAEESRIAWADEPEDDPWPVIRERASKNPGRAKELSAEEVERRAQAQAEDLRRHAEIIAAIHVITPVVRPGRRVIAHVGPTNSGKTHAALEALMSAPSGAYGAPLRLLAMEVYDRLVARLGVERVGLRTGEERIRPDAPFVRCHRSR